MTRHSHKPLGCLAGIFRFFLRLGILLLILIMIPVAINFYMILSSQADFRSPEDVVGLGAEVALVFGAGLNPDGSPSPILAERLDTGIELYHSGAAKALLLSGDGSQDLYYNETRAMSLYVQEQGVPASAIWQDPHGLSTRHSIDHAQRDYNLESALLVSQRFHLYRAVYIAKAKGLPVYGIPSDKQTWPNQATREIPARLKDFARVHISHLPQPWSDRILPLFDYTVNTVKESQD